MLDLLPHPAVIAHRGASAYAPENTLEAFRLAVEFQADALELDVRFTADYHPIVFHDRSLSRTTSGTGLVSHTDLSTIRTYQTRQSQFPSKSGEPVPLLEEVLQELGPKIPINIEIKSARLFPSRLTAAVGEILEDYPAANLLISSFNPFVLTSMHRLLPEIPLGLILGRSSFSLWFWIAMLPLLPISSLHPHYSAAVPGLISRCHARGLKVFAYTVNDPDTMNLLVQSGVDGFFTDDPLLARRVLGKEIEVK